MKFVCLNCETYMTFQKVEKPGEGSLGVFFGCPSCEAKFSMVTNPGETQMVASLGVKLGGRTEAAEPFEMTRGTLKDEAQAGAGQMAAYLNEKIQSGQPATAAPKPISPVSSVSYTPSPFGTNRSTCVLVPTGASKVAGDTETSSASSGASTPSAV